MSKPSSTPRLPSKDDLSQLTHLSSLLHLLHHRNHNQHRRSPWYRHFSLFRRHLTSLLSDYTTLTSTPTTNLERARLKTQSPALHKRVAQRLQFWQDVLVARWQRAFSQVVADGRFSVLGLVMLGALGGVCKVVGVTEGLEGEGQAEIERVLEESGREAWVDDERGFGEVVGREGKDGVVVARGDEGEPVAREADVGEVVAREEVDDGVPVERNEAKDDRFDDTKSKKQKKPLPVDQSEDDEPKVVRKRSPSPSATKVAKPKTKDTKKRTIETKSKPAKKKRKKGGDAIDDLFSGW